MARREKQINGSMPLSTLRAKIDYGLAEAATAPQRARLRREANKTTANQASSTKEIHVPL